MSEKKIVIKEEVYAEMEGMTCGIIFRLDEEKMEEDGSSVQEIEERIGTLFLENEFYCKSHFCYYAPGTADDGGTLFFLTEVLEEDEVFLKYVTDYYMILSGTVEDMLNTIRTETIFSDVRRKMHELGNQCINKD